MDFLQVHYRMAGTIAGRVVAIHTYVPPRRRVTVLNTAHISATNRARTKSRSAEHAKKQSENM